MIPLLATLLVFAQRTVIVLPGPDVNRTNPTWARADLGIIDPLSDAPFIRRTFKIKNETAEDVLLAAPQLGCACTNARIDGKPVDGYRLATGAEAGVTVDLDFARIKVGHFEKYVWLTAKGRNEPIVTLELAGTMKPAVVIDPPSVRLGKARAKDLKPIEVKVSIDRRLVALFPDATLQPSIPDVEVREQIKPPMPTTSVATSPETGNMIERTFSVAPTPDARNGVINAILRMSPGKPGTYDQRAAVLRLRSQLMSVEASLTGELIGTYNASPGTVVFGNIVGARPATRQITIVSDAPIDPATLRVESKVKGLEAKFADSKPSTKLALNVTFGGDLPGGAYDVQLVISNQTNEQLVIPVLAYITR